MIGMVCFLTKFSGKREELKKPDNYEGSEKQRRRS